jgi:hypothetical protein
MMVAQGPWRTELPACLGGVSVEEDGNHCLGPEQRGPRGTVGVMIKKFSGRRGSNLTVC